MSEILGNDELEVLNDTMRLGTLHPFGRQRQVAKRLCKKNLMTELTIFGRFKITAHGQQVFNEIKGNRK